MGLLSMIADAGSALFRFAKAAWASIRSAGKTVIHAGKRVLEVAAQAVSRAVSTAWDAVKTTVKTVYEVVKRVAQKMGEYAEKVVQWGGLVLEAVKTYWEDLPQETKERVIDVILARLKELLVKYPLLYAVTEILITPVGDLLKATVKGRYVKEEEATVEGKPHRAQSTGDIDLSSLSPHDLDALKRTLGKQGKVIKISHGAFSDSAPDAG